jgi:hypothetical protein
LAYQLKKKKTLFLVPLTTSSPGFKPERFEIGDGDTDKLMPFGLGRRADPKAVLAQCMVSLTLWSLIRCYEWGRVTKEEVEVTEGNAVTMPKAVPLSYCLSQLSKFYFILNYII